MEKCYSFLIINSLQDARTKVKMGRTVQKWTYDCSLLNSYSLPDAFKRWIFSCCVRKSSSFSAGIFFPMIFF